MGHRLVNPDTLPPAVGFTHAVVPEAGRAVWLGGQAAHRPDGSVAGPTLVEEFDQAAANVVAALAAAGGRPEHLVSVQIYVTDLDAYRGALEAIGAAWRRHLGRHYPAVALLGVSGLFDPRCHVELVAVAVVPD